ncbi:MAG: hypothetical protein ACRC1V_01305 [Plesiomonas sp.]
MYITPAGRMGIHNGTVWNELTPVATAPLLNQQIIRANGDGNLMGSEFLTFRGAGIGVGPVTAAGFFHGQGANAGNTGVIVTNTDLTGYSGFSGNDNGGGERFFSGWGNSGVSESWRASKAYIGTGGVDLAVSLNRAYPLLYLQHNATGNLQRIGIGTNSPTAAVDFALNGAVRQARLSADPTGLQGLLYTRTSDGALRYHDGTNWISLGAEGGVSLSTGQIGFGNGTSLIGNNNLFWDNAAEGLRIVSSGTLADRGLSMYQNSSTTDGVSYGYFKSRGTFSTPTAVATGDIIYGINHRAFRGASYSLSSALSASIVSGTVTSTSVPTSHFWTKSTGTDNNFNLGFLIDHNSRVRIAGAANLGTAFPPAISGFALDVNDDSPGANVMSIRNHSNTGFSTLVAKDNADVVQFATGYGNPGTGSIHANRAYASTGSKDYFITTNGTTTPFFVQAANQRIGIRTSTPLGTLHIQDEVAVDGNRGLYIAQHSSTVGGSAISILRSRGTAASPTDVQAGDILMAFNTRSRRGGLYSEDNALFGFYVSGAVTSTSVPTSFYVTKSPGTNFNYNAGFLIDHNSRVRIAGAANIGDVVAGTVALSTHALNVNDNISESDLISIRNHSLSGYSGTQMQNSSGSAMAGFGYANSGVINALFQDRVYLQSINRHIVFTTNSSSALVFLNQTDQSLTVNNGLKIASGAGTPEGAITAGPGSIYANTSATGSFALQVKASGTGNTGYEPVALGAERQLNFTEGSNVITQSLLNTYRLIYIRADVSSGAGSNNTIDIPAPSAANLFRRIIVIANDQSATQNVSVTGSLWYATAGNTAPADQSSLQLSGNATSKMAATFVCLEVSTGVFRWVLNREI